MTRIQLIYMDFLNYIHALISEYPFNPCHPCCINHFQHMLNSYKTHHNGIFKNALSLK
jgi:hypothetical protein